MSLELLQPLLGVWEGQATISAPGRDPLVMRQTELVRTRNAGTIVTIEGSSFPLGAGSAAPLFTAFAVVTPGTDGALLVHAYSSGRFLETAWEISPGRFAWTVPVPVPTQYEAVFDPTHWTETGHADGNEVFRMELHRCP